ncbi:MAG: phage holin family protein [Gemmatimonadota bacterium]
MLQFLLHLLLSAALLLAVSHMVEGFEVRSFGSALGAALVLGIVNAILRPIVLFVSLPITIVTFGLFLLVVNALMLMVAGAIVPGIKLRGFGPAFWGALLLSILNLVIGFIF